MDAVTTSSTAAPDGRRAHRRVGAAATGSFLALLLLSDVAGASLPVAAALLAATAAARAVTWVPVDDPRAQRLAGEYLEPLRVWCLVAIAVHLVALLGSGDPSLPAIGLSLLPAMAAGLLEAPAQERATQAPAVHEAPVAPLAPDASLWAHRNTDDETQRAGLWGRSGPAG